MEQNVKRDPLGCVYDSSSTDEYGTTHYVRYSALGRGGGSAYWSSEHDCNPICGCHLEAKCSGCGVCMTCDGCYCFEDLLMAPPAGSHSCPCGCRLNIGRTRLACPDGWYRLPRPIRDRINLTWRARRPDLSNVEAASAHRDAVAEALAWYREHPAGVGEG